MTGKLLFRIYGEMYVVDLESVLYFKADDHYTHVYYDTGAHFTMPFGLSKVEAAIERHMAGTPSYLLRLGRTYIINISRIYHVNAIRQVVVLADSHGSPISLHLSKAVLYSLMERLGKNNPSDVSDPSLLQENRSSSQGAFLFRENIDRVHE